MSSEISRALNVTQFTCKHRNTVPVQSEVACVLPYVWIALASAHLLEWGTDSKLECASLTNRQKDFQTNHRMSRVPEKCSFQNTQEFLAHLGGNF